MKTIPKKIKKEEQPKQKTNTIDPIQPMQVSGDYLFTKVGKLTIENEVLQQQIVFLQTELNKLKEEKEVKDEQ